MVLTGEVAMFLRGFEIGPALTASDGREASDARDRELTDPGLAVNGKERTLSKLLAAVEEGVGTGMLDDRDCLVDMILAKRRCAWDSTENYAVLTCYAMHIYFATKPTVLVLILQLEKTRGPMWVRDQDASSSQTTGNVSPTRGFRARDFLALQS